METANSQLKKVLVVCTGNTCRSPMAEGWLNRHLAGKGWVAESAGVGAGDGSPASPEAIDVMREIGIDIEWTGRRLDQPEQVSERYFSQAERDALRNLPEAQKRQGFFNAWTRKEAYIKARGKGLYLALDQFDVSLDPAQPAQLLATRDDPAQTSRWQMRELDPGDGYVAALVVEGGGWQTSCYDWCV